MVPWEIFGCWFLYTVQKLVQKLVFPLKTAETPWSKSKPILKTVVKGEILTVKPFVNWVSEWIKNGQLTAVEFIENMVGLKTQEFSRELIATWHLPTKVSSSACLVYFKLYVSTRRRQMFHFTGAPKVVFFSPEKLAGYQHWPTFCHFRYRVWFEIGNFK